VSGVVDEIEVLDALTLKSRESVREKVKRGDVDNVNTVPVHIPDNFGKDSELVFILNGEDIGSLSAIKIAKLAMKIKQLTRGD
jgi:hypothetical protein